MVLLTFHTALVLIALSRGGGGVSESFKCHCLVGGGLAGHRWLHLDLMCGHAGLGSECITEIGGIILPLEAGEGS